MTIRHAGLTLASLFASAVLLASTANLIVKEDLHPALAYLLLRTTAEVHGQPHLFEHQGEFPAPRDADFPLSAEAQR